MDIFVCVRYNVYESIGESTRNDLDSKNRGTTSSVVSSVLCTRISMRDVIFLSRHPENVSNFLRPLSHRVNSQLPVNATAHIRNSWQAIKGGKENVSEWCHT